MDGSNIPDLDKTTNIEELLYMIGNREFIVYKHEKEREGLYRRIQKLEQSVEILTKNNSDLLLKLDTRRSKRGPVSNKSRGKQGSRTRVLPKET